MEKRSRNSQNCQAQNVDEKTLPLAWHKVQVFQLRLLPRARAHRSGALVGGCQWYVWDAAMGVSLWKLHAYVLK